MATFPIKYNERSPSGQVGAVPMSAEMARTGLPEVFSAASEAILEQYHKVQNANDAMELSTLQRKADEIQNARVSALQGVDPNDDEAISSINNKAKSDWDGLGSKRGKVNNAFKISMNNSQPGWDARFSGEVLQKKAKAAGDQLEINGQLALEKGDLPGYYKILELGKATDIISKEDYDYRSKAAPNESVLAQAGKLIYSEQPAAGLKKLEELDTGSLSEPRAKYAQQLKNAAQEVLKTQTDAVENEATLIMHNNRMKPAPERLNISDNIIRKLSVIQDNIPASRYNALINEVERFEKGKERPNDPFVYGQLIRQVEQLHLGIGNPTVVRKNIIDAYPSLDDNHFEALTKLSEEKIVSYNADTITRLRQEAVPVLAPRMMMAERLMAEEAVATTPEAKEALKAQIRIIMAGEDAKLDAERLALYLDQVHQWLRGNPDEANLYGQGKVLMGKFNKYSDAQIRQMQAQVESGIQQATGKKTWKFKARMPDGSIQGSDTGKAGTWQTIQ